MPDLSPPVIAAIITVLGAQSVLEVVKLALKMTAKSKGWRQDELSEFRADLQERLEREEKRGDERDLHLTRQAAELVECNKVRREALGRIAVLEAKEEANLGLIASLTEEVRTLKRKLSEAGT